ncbi:DUF1292 domain-containing protein [Aquibacillus halophilus]|uniref:DUF1292 domain-containing protein n=1 Tax=Aquibacillus halophilus TaxID=930132 RepID=A0A6A8DTB1_9BACI|nr:DUF1292 domain-containing protein [Aquibacillus halophilus]MRH44452.1 DUF1292 domain-containing protein [Aquibacillus halophilus]
MDNIEVGEVFTIIDENETEQTVEVLAKVTVEGSSYVAVSFLEDLSEENEEGIDIFPLKIDDNRDLSAIESDEEFNKVSEAFDAIFDEAETDQD